MQSDRRIVTDRPKACPNVLAISGAERNIMEYVTMPFERAIRSAPAPSRRAALPASPADPRRDSDDSGSAVSRKRPPMPLDAVLARAVRRRTDRECVLRGAGGAVSGAATTRATAVLLQRAPTPGLAPPVSADTAAQAINEWLKGHPPAGQQTNWSIGVANDGDIYISKVGGVTGGTKYVRDELGPFIQEHRYEVGRTIWLAQAYNTAYTSGNHAEMCVMAAAGVGQLTKIYCVADHCAFCAQLMTVGTVALGADTGGSDQQGWAHPFAPIFLGSQVNSNTEGQLAQLTKLPQVPTQHDAASAGVNWLPSAPKAGKCQAWM